MPLCFSSLSQVQSVAKALVLPLTHYIHRKREKGARDPCYRVAYRLIN